MSSPRPEMRIRPRLARKYYYLSWSLAPLMIAAALGSYYSEGKDLNRALYTAGLGVGIAAFLHTMLYLVQRLAIRHRPSISKFADTVEFRTADGDVKSLDIETISTVHLEPGPGNSKITVNIEGGRFSFLYPGSFNRYKWQRFWKSVF